VPMLTPDPTFYPSPTMATQSPPETLAYLALINPSGTGRADAIGIVDLDPNSNAYGRLVGQTDMPSAGDELHHFGWNPAVPASVRTRRIRTWSGAISSCLAFTRRTFTRGSTWTGCGPRRWW
jgi:hypothetical protein